MRKERFSGKIDLNVSCLTAQSLTFLRAHMEGDLSKNSIHINESFVHAIYIGIVVNSYSNIVAYI